MKYFRFGTAPITGTRALEAKNAHAKNGVRIQNKEVVVTEDACFILRLARARGLPWPKKEKAGWGDPTGPYLCAYFFFFLLIGFFAAGAFLPTTWRPPIRVSESVVLNGYCRTEV